MSRPRSLLCRAAGLLEAQPLAIDKATSVAFDALLDIGGTIDYRIERPKHEFLRYATERRDLLLHGSPRPGIEEFAPREQTDFRQRLVTAVFATSDGIWPLFFAVIRRAKGESIINTCIQVRETRGLRCFYYFSTSTDPRGRDSWAPGFVYVFAKDGFRKHPRGPEWTCAAPVRPVAVLPVTPNDFPFRHAVRRHRAGESAARHILRSVLRRPALA